MEIKEIKSKEWVKRGKWFNTIIMDEIFQEGESTKYSKKLGYPFKRSLGVWLQNGDYYDLRDEKNDVKKLIIEEIKKNKNFLRDYAEDCLKYGEGILNFSKKYREINENNLGNDELGKIYKNVIQKSKEYIPFMYSMHLIDGYLTKKFNEMLEKHIKKNGLSKEDFFEYKAALALPSRKIFVLQEREDLLKLAMNYTDEKDLIIHRDKYAWLNCTYFEDEPYDVEYYKKRIEKIENPIEEFMSTKKSESKLKNRQKEIMKEIDEEFKEVAEIVQLFGFLRSFRVDVPHAAIGNIWNIIKEITKRINIEPIEIRMLSSKEVGIALNGKDVKDLIKIRKNRRVNIIVENERTIITDEHKVKEIEKLFEEKIDKVSFVKGQIAFPGKITGKVKVLHSTDDIPKIKKGNILVISMTDPNYLSAMEKASAFITDFGGILCHAAIVSREMKKPCIIGTKNATKLLKDNDLIEVDADKGIVKIIK